MTAWKRVTLTSASTSPTTVPSDWNNASNLAEVIGCGGNGANGSTTVSGGGGGSAAYTYIRNMTLTAGASLPFQVGAGGSALDTWFSAAATLIAKSGGNGSGTTAGIAGSTAGSIPAGSAWSGAAGGAGATNTNSSGGGGGGSAGPHGGGKAGGAGAGSNSAQRGGGGGGGADDDAATVGATTAATTGGAGGNGILGSGAGTAGASAGAGGTATLGGGGGGGGGTGGNGGAGGAFSCWTSALTIGGGGGGGGSGASATIGKGGAAASYGGGGGGSGRTSSGTGVGGAGGGGLIVATYTPTTFTSTHVEWAADDKNAAFTVSGTYNNILTASSALKYPAARVTTPVATGKWYFEFIATTVTGGDTAIGFCGEGESLGFWLGKTALSTGASAAGTVYYNGGGTASATAAWTTNGSAVAVAFDVDNGMFWLRVTGGNWNNSATADPANNVGGIALRVTAGSYVYVAANAFQQNDVFTCNFGDTGFTYAVPTGFASLSSAYTPAASALFPPFPRRPPTQLRM